MGIVAQALAIETASLLVVKDAGPRGDISLCLSDLGGVPVGKLFAVNRITETDRGHAVLGRQSGAAGNYDFGHRLSRALGSADRVREVSERLVVFAVTGASSADCQRRARALLPCRNGGAVYLWQLLKPDYGQFMDFFRERPAERFVWCW